MVNGLMVNPRNSWYQELLNDWKPITLLCPKCHRSVIDFSADTSRNPEQIMVHIARHNGDEKYSKFDNSAIDGFQQNVQVGSSKYKVVSAIQHFGPSVRIGHYVAWVHSQHGWLKFDDLNEEHPVIQKEFPWDLKNFYLLFLEKHSL